MKRADALKEVREVGERLEMLAHWIQEGADDGSHWPSPWHLDDAVASYRSAIEAATRRHRR